MYKVGKVFKIKLDYDVIGGKTVGKFLHCDLHVILYL